MTAFSQYRIENLPINGRATTRSRCSKSVSVANTSDNGALINQLPWRSIASVIGQLWLR